MPKCNIETIPAFPLWQFQNVAPQDTRTDVSSYVSAAIGVIYHPRLCTLSRNLHTYTKNQPFQGFAGHKNLILSIVLDDRIGLLSWSFSCILRASCQQPRLCSSVYCSPQLLCTPSLADGVKLQVCSKLCESVYLLIEDCQAAQLQPLVLLE